MIVTGSALATEPAGIESMLLVGVGGAAGALLRFGVGERIDVDRFPVAVVAVNVLGTFLATLLALLSPAHDVVLFGSVGFCGSLTTFSTFSVRTVGLWAAGRRLAAVALAVGTLLACLLGVGLAASAFLLM